MPEVAKAMGGRREVVRSHRHDGFFIAQLHGDNPTVYPLGAAADRHFVEISG